MTPQAIRRGDVFALPGALQRVHLLACDDPTLAEVATRFLKGIDLSVIVAEPFQDKGLDDGWSDWVEAWLGRLGQLSGPQTFLLFASDWRGIPAVIRAMDAAGWQRFGMVSLTLDGEEPKHLHLAAQSRKAPISRILWSGERPLDQVLEALPLATGTLVDLFGRRSAPLIAERFGLSSITFETSPGKVAAALESLALHGLRLSAPCREFFGVLRRLAQGDNLRLASELEGFERRSVYRWMEKDPSFKQAVQMVTDSRWRKFAPIKG